MESLSCRVAEQKDLERIVEMLADDKLGSKRERCELPLPPAYTEAFFRIDSDPYQELMVAISDDQVIATFQLTYIQYLTYIGSMRAQIEAVRVHKDYRSKGIGKFIFNFAIQRAKEEGAHVLQLTTDRQRPDALRFYESLGFVASHEGMKLHFP